MAAPWQVGRDPHASDAELVRLLDGAVGAEQARVQAHADACAECAQRLGRLRRRATGLSLVLTDGDDVAALDRRAAGLAAGFGATVPRRPPVRLPGYLRVAAVLVGLLALGWAVQPVRAWIVARWTALTASDVVLRPAPRSQIVAPPAPEPATSVAFVPGAADFVVAFDIRPAGGRLEVRHSAGERLTFTASGRADVLVLPDELRIRDAPASTADYRVELPAGVTRLRVRVGERTVLDVVPSPNTAGWTVDLARGRSAP